MRPYVWIVGFPRCGTASLCEALRILGWNPIHNPRNWDQLEGHDAAGDVMITAHWRELGRMFPGSMFILNTRRFEDWLVSLTRIPGFWKSPLAHDRYYRQKVYRGCRPGNAAAMAEVWRRHHEQVREAIPQERLLELSLPFDWEPLCTFLVVASPSGRFPWLNRRHCRDAVVRLETS